jgi:mannose-1-phosphate guanylyltransferase
MEMKHNAWALVLAAGDGSRLRSLTTDPSGVPVPKQFCSLTGGRSLLRAALERAERVVPRQRIVSVVALGHRGWWRREVATLPPANVVVQPANRGTAAGVLLPLLSILRRDPGARLLILPSDHFVGREETLAEACRTALARLEEDPERLVLLGITPDSADSEYGWIVPGASLGNGFSGVTAFVEKPRPRIAADLRRRGGLWNSFLVAATGSALLALYGRRLPALLVRLAGAPISTRLGAAPELTAIYDELPPHDFSRAVLQGAEGTLSLLPVPACGWSDLGTPARVAQCIDQLPPAPRRERPALPYPAPIDLARSHSRHPPAP